MLLSHADTDMLTLAGPKKGGNKVLCEACADILQQEVTMIQHSTNTSEGGK